MQKSSGNNQGTNPGGQGASNASSGSKQAANQVSQQQIMSQTGVQSQAATTFEKTIHFNQAHAIVWQVKFILNQISSKKALAQASNEIESLSTKFGKDFDKYLLKELLEQVDLKDPVKAQKDKNEPFKVQLLTQEFNKAVQKPDFLNYFGEIASTIGFNERFTDFITELTRRLKLSFTNQILIALALVESGREESQPEAIKILKLKLQEYFNLGRPEVTLPDYALHQIMFLYSTHPDMILDDSRENIMQYLVDSNPLKATSHVSLRGAMLQDLMFENSHVDDPSISLFKEGNGIDNLDKSYKMLEPWHLLLELGHMSSYNYNQLLKILEDFKDINEKTMTRTLLNLAVNHTGQDDQASKIAQNTFEANRKADSSHLKKEVADKKNAVTWSIDNLVRAFRELFSHLNWQKVYEALSEIQDELVLDAKAFSTFLQITNKSKPQNLAYPLPMILQTSWASQVLQLSFIENSIQFYIDKKDKSINFFKSGDRRQEVLDDLTGVKDKVSPEFLHIWLSVDLVERLLILSDSHHFHKVRSLFEAPLKQLPEYLLLTLSLCKPPTKSSLMIDELLSLLLPQFLGNHPNSILVLQALWKNNQSLMIRAICELCRHDQRIMNLSRVLDITQEVKESLMPIVDCEDYYFAVNLAILAGKRDFLHYDVWLQRRITDVGTPFIKALLKYLKEHIIMPIIEYQKRGVGGEVGSNAEQIEGFKQQVLERSHLSKEKLQITSENLASQANNSNSLIKNETREQVREVATKLGELFPYLIAPGQNSEEIDNAANDYFQRVFSAEPSQVDSKICELIDIMQRFRTSEVKKDQEIYACMLHSLFDEYRFLHKYPMQYLEKIAKLYGAIIKNKIIDGTLQDIALKFVVEAFRRDGKRMKFGVIVIRHIMELLPSFPTFFDGIYDLRHNLNPSEPQLIKEIEELYERTMPKTARTRAPSGPLDEIKALKDADENLGAKYRSSFSSFSNESIEESKKEESKIAKAAGVKGGIEQAQQVPQMPKINESDFLTTFQQNQIAQPPPPQPAPTKKEQKAAAKNQEAQKQAQQQQQQQPVFNPQYKVRGTASQQEQQPQPQALPTLQTQQNFTSTNTPVFQPLQPILTEGALPQGINLTGGFGQGFNPSSQAFSRRPGAQAQPQLPPVNALGLSVSTPTPFQLAPSTHQPPPPQQPQQLTPLVSNPLANNLMNARPFRPTRSPAPQIAHPTFNHQFLVMQQSIEAKMQKAHSEGVKVKLEDVIEDSNLPGSNISEDIKMFCNTTGKNNFAQKMEELKALINQNPTVYLNYFINQILIKKITAAPNLVQIYADAIRQIGNKDSISITIGIILDIFRKCMLINEDVFNQITVQRSQIPGNHVKAYLTYLGSFLGILTVATNRPIYAKELDLKQLLVEGFNSDKLKLTVFFVCRILKECQKSTVFKHNNPWVKAILEILREIYDFGQANNQTYGDVIMEIDALYKAFGIQNSQEVQHTGFLKAALHQQYTTQSQQYEVFHMLNKAKIIPAVQPPIIPQQQNNQVILDYQQRPPSVSPGPNLAFGGVPASFPGSQNPPPPTGGMILMPNSQRDFELQNQQISNYNHICQKVELNPEFLSMIGLLSETLTPENERILRKIVADAVDQSIIEILPPVVDRSVTIALITTRELVLKDFTFDSNYNKILKAADLIVQNLAGSLALVTCREPLKMQLTTNLKKCLQNQIMQLYNNIEPQNMPQFTENLISELAQQASKDNLELGCKMIKKAVIQRALTKVREDIQITQAIKVRQMSVNQNDFRAKYVDESLISQFADLPKQLRPNEDGLSDAQFQVYEDFANLSRQSMATGGAVGSGPSLQPIADLDPLDDIEAYLKHFDQLPFFDKPFEKQLSAKLAQMSGGDQTKKLVQFCDNIFYSVCERMAVQQQNIHLNEKVTKILDFLQFVVGTVKIGGNEDLQVRLTQKFLAMDGSVNNNTEMTLILMRRGILSASKWDSQIASFIKDSLQFSITKELLTFLKNFLEMVSIQKDLTSLTFPNIMHILMKMSDNDSYISQTFQNVIQDHRARTLWTKDTLRDYFNQWSIISLEEGDNREKQEQEVNRFFTNLKEQGLYRDAKVIQKFFKSMVELSVERALYEGENKRPEDRIVYRYLESFLNFCVVSLMSFTQTGDSISKHDFMAQLFEAIHQVLDQDHKTQKGDFNQKPYYRILINILRLLNNAQIFNQKAHLHVLFSLADLFIKLNPKEYPAFSFAWLELISHKFFMPEFLSSALPAPPLNPSQPGTLLNPAQQQQSRKSTAATTLQSQQQQQQQQQQIPLSDGSNFQKWFKYKELIVHLFSFLKANMIVGLTLSEPLAKFYEATMRVVLVLKQDYPEFLCDFHFNLVNSLPEHCVQLRNIILSAQPRSIPYTDPFSKNLKVDTLQEIQQPPRSQSNYENYLTQFNLREDLEKYFRLKEKDKNLVRQIADKMMQSEEIVNGRKRINSSIFNAVALFIQSYAHQNKQKQQSQQKECYDILKSIILILTPETRLCLLNSIVNELRYINCHTYFYSWMVIYLFNDVDESIQEQITRILIERLQTHGPHPWGLCITFRELLQNPKYNFAKKSFVVKNQAVIDQLMQTKLSSFYTFWTNNKMVVYQQQQQQMMNPQMQQQMQYPEHQ